ncbi:hypothetical protein [Nocardioides humilatus]|uniref:hypothetical protein n=1 Tax=Nocardioides humilatus TaxID=2607660 RepID=UPI00165F24A7|nr:hypothetical protein [Nocardioides humilatus]
MNTFGAFARLGLACAMPAAAGALAVPVAHATDPAPKIIAAFAIDADKDDKVDRFRLTYSEPVKHALDTSGFPFVVDGYTVTRVTATTTRKLLILVKEKTATDIDAHPSITYTRTTAQPVRDAGGQQAIAQTFDRTKAVDLDGDGYAWVERDCAPKDPAINPGAADHPDLAFTDQDCDGIDGDRANGIFVDPDLGNDLNPGTPELPVQTLSNAFNLRNPNRSEVYATGLWAPNAVAINVPDGVSVYGGYDSTWARSTMPAVTNGKPWTIAGTSTLQLVRILTVDDMPALTVSGDATLDHVNLENGPSSTNSVALKVVGVAKVRMIGGALVSGQAGGSYPGDDGPDGSNGVKGGNGEAGSCDTFSGGGGGVPEFQNGNPNIGGFGGIGGNDAGGSSANGLSGDPGTGGAAGGAGGAEGNPGKAGSRGTDGADGLNGADGHLVVGSFSVNGYVPATSTAGGNGTDGKGGGGGGGGGGQVGATVLSGQGNGGGAGGQGGLAGRGGKGGKGGYGSIAAYVPFGKLTLQGTVVTTGQAGNGGAGGVGGDASLGGVGGNGAAACLSEVGRGGNGGDGGNGGSGGDGGAGQGGPSIGVYGGIYAQIDVTTATFNLGPVGTGPGALRENVHRP